MTQLWKDQFVRINEFTRTGTKRSMTRNIVWHYTANPGASAANHFTYFNSTLPEQNRKAIQTYGKAEAEKRNLIRWANAHIFIDSREAICIVPLDELAHHASQANPYSIGIELCIEKDGTFHPNTIKQAIAIGKELNRRYNLTISDQLRHYDVNGKICPKPWVDNPNAWLDFKQQLFKEEDEVKREEYEQLQTQIRALEKGQAEIFRVLNNGRVALNIPEEDQKLASWAADGHEYVMANKISDGLRPEDFVRRQEVWTMLERDNKKGAK